MVRHFLNNTTSQQPSYITPANNNNSTRWIPKNSNGWTEVISKQHKKQQQNDPFAGMKSCVDYEQEIERLKQLVPTIIEKRHRRSTSPDSDSSVSTCDSDYEEEKARFLSFVRNWTGDIKQRWQHDYHENTSVSLWQEPTPWNYSIKSNEYFDTRQSPLVISMPKRKIDTAVQPPPINNSYQLFQPVQNHHPTTSNAVKPIGMGRRRV